MSAKRIYIDRHDGETGEVTQCGTGHRTIGKAEAQKAIYRAQQPMGASTWFTYRTGTK